MGAALGLDLDETEKACASAAAAISVDPDGQILGVTKKGDGGLTPDVLLVSAMIAIGCTSGCANDVYQHLT